jgi:hypothetical protein
VVEWFVRELDAVSVDEKRIHMLDGESRADGAYR